MKKITILLLLVATITAATAQNIQSGVYYIKSASNTNYALAVGSTKTKSGNPIVCIKKWQKAKSQQWKVVKENNGGISIHSMTDERATIDVENFLYESGTAIQLFDYHGGDNQRWSPTSKGSNKYILRSIGNRNFSIAANNKTKLTGGLSVRLRKNNGEYPNVWLFQKVQNSTSSSSSSSSSSSKGKMDGLIFKSGDLHYKILSSNTCEVTNRVTSIKTKDVVVPPSITYKGVTYKVIGIGSGAFSNEVKMTSVTLPSTLQYINEKAFMGTLIKMVTIHGATKVKSYAFKDCKNLTSVSFSGTGWSFSTNSFSGCNKLKEVYLHTTKKAKDFKFVGASPKVKVY